MIDNPERTLAALRRLQSSRDATFAHLRSRLDTIDKQLAETMYQLRGVLDFHATSKRMIPAVVLDAWLANETSRTRHIEEDLEGERAEFQAKLDRQDWSPAQVEDVFTFCATLHGRMHNASREKTRKTLEFLRFAGRIIIENGEKVLYPLCALGNKQLLLHTTSSSFNIQELNRRGMAVRSPLDRDDP